MEIERKFLPAYLPDGWENAPHRELLQGYLCRKPVLRVRRDGEKYILTVKGPGKMAREEHEYPLKRSEFEHLLAKADGRLIRKTRYRLPCGKYTAELDIFEDELKGLRLAEVEFPTVEEALAFTPPAWMGREVTDDPRYHNAHLALDELPELDGSVLR